MAGISAIGLFCESIRNEVEGTHTLVGIMPDNLNIPTVPIALGKLSLYVRIMIDPAIDPGPLSVWLIHPNGEERELQTLDSNVINENRAASLAAGAPITGIISQAIMPGFPILDYGRFRAVLRTRDTEILCGALNFQKMPTSSSEPAPPSTQSSDAQRPTGT
jgi:hypothetical protein